MGLRSFQKSEFLKSIFFIFSEKKSLQFLEVLSFRVESCVDQLSRNSNPYYYLFGISEALSWSVEEKTFFRKVRKSYSAFKNIKYVKV